MKAEGTAGFSVIVAVRATSPGLETVVAAIAAQDLPRERCELLLALEEPGLPEPLARRVQALGGRVVPADGARGAGAARNAAAALARFDWLAFTTDEGAPAPDWLARAAERIARTPVPDAIVGLALAPGSRPPEAREMRFDPANLFVRREWFGRVGGWHEGYSPHARGGCWRQDADLGFAFEETNAIIVREESLVVMRRREPRDTWEPVRWAARHQDDALLARRHPRLFRERIGVGRLGPLRVRQPYVRACLGVVLALVLAAVLIVTGRGPQAVPLLAIAALLELVVWARWRFHPLLLPAALLAPFVLVAAFASLSTRSRPGTRGPR